MAHPRGESGSDAVRLDFDRRLMLQFRGSLVTSGGARSEKMRDLMLRNLCNPILMFPDPAQRKVHSLRNGFQYQFVPKEIEVTIGAIICRR
jgi:hypothetical protein